MIIAAPGSRSLGFRMRELPEAIAIGIDHSGIIAGKLNLPTRLKVSFTLGGTTSTCVGR